MYCSKCGSQVGEDANFCSQCGIRTTSTTNDKSDERQQAQQQERPKLTVSFQEFRKRKESMRQEHFQFKSKTKAKLAKKENDPKQVIINIGVMKFKDCKLGTCRGRTLPLTLSPTAVCQTILDMAVRKHGNHDKHIHTGLSYTLLYPDGSEVINLPGTKEPFMLRKYKEDLGKTYSRITLFICTKADFLLSEIPTREEFESDTEDEVDKELMKDPFHQDEGIEIPSANMDKQDERALEPSCSYQMVRQTECPTCFLSFPMDKIAEHADTCADIWIGDVEGDGCCENDTLEGATNDHVTETTIQETTLTIKEILNQLAEENLSHEKRLNIRRKHMWTDFVDARRKHGISCTNKIRVVFLGEPAIDDGGPRREFFSDILNLIQRKFFDSGKPISSTVSLVNGEFGIAGELMVMSLLQGGPAPCFLHSNVFQYLAQQPLSPITVDTRFKTVTTKIEEASSDKEIQSTLVSDEGLEALQEIGYTGVPHKETKLSAQKILQLFCIQSEFNHCMSELMQLKEGLRSCNVLQSVCENPDLWKSIFTGGHSKSTTAMEFLDQLIVNFSVSQLLKDKEIDTYKQFCDFLQECTDGSDVTIPQLVKWCTGTSHVPPLGFPKKMSLSFVHGCPTGCQCRPTASTCDLLIKLPVHINTHDAMESMMISALHDSHGFGLI